MKTFVCFQYKPAYPQYGTLYGAVEWKSGEEKPLDALPPTLSKMQTIYNVANKRLAVSQFRNNLIEGKVQT